MHGWIQITVAAATVAAIFVVALLVFLWRRFSSSKHKDLGVIRSASERADSLQIGISKHPPVNLPHLDLDSKARTNNYYASKREVSLKQRFNWANHPSLLTDAVENGWSRFAFASSYSSSPSARSTRSTLLGSRGGGDRRESEVEISWEICQGSTDFLQKIRLNSGLKKPGSRPLVIKTRLPLPGPPVGSSPFPQEAYFEITILDDDFDYDPFRNRNRNKIEGEKAKLIQENRKAKRNLESESLVHFASDGNGNKNFEELRDGGKQESVMLMTVGFSTAGGSFPLMIPGTCTGSIGFNSDGSVYLDGIKLILESKKEEWGKLDTVIGCGYNPNQRKVFFTVDSQLVHLINCKSDEFGAPLYPTLASNIDTTILVNFGQTVFKYLPANSLRTTPNPCFIGHFTNSHSLSYDDNKELFSIGRLDSQWLNRSKIGHNYDNNNHKGLDFDVESEGDLFEIALDGSGKDRIARS